jgi:hypothetical protein
MHTLKNENLHLKIEITTSNQVTNPLIRAKREHENCIQIAERLDFLGFVTGGVATTQ